MSNKLCNIEQERKIQPRLFNIPEAYPRGYQENGNDSQGFDQMDHNSNSEAEGESIDQLMNDLRLENQKQKIHTDITSTRSSTNHLSNDTFLQERHRRSLRKFEPLNLGGKTLTGISIGGFDIDISAASQKAREVIPLPSSKLPVIFLDEELNFYHHFFQGLNYIFGKNSMTRLINSVIPNCEEGERMLLLITEMLENGYERGDNEIVIFVKKVVTSTFELSDSATKKYTSDRIFVVANLWGFQYIEPGMQCDCATVTMWLSMCYGHYKTIWFNTFKLTGVPDFSHNKSLPVEQDRISNHKRDEMYTSNTNKYIGSEHSLSGRTQIHDVDNQSISSRRHRRQGRKNSQITRWIASN